jgi:hypothetical protein
MQEQGLPVLAPGTYSALLLTYREILAFRRKWIKRRPEWFRKGSKPIGQRELVGTYQYVYSIASVLLKITDQLMCHLGFLKTENSTK